MSQPPRAKIVEHLVVAKHGTRRDPYFWLRDDTRADPDVIAYLQAENAYRETCMAASVPLQTQLYDEIVSRIAQDDESVPVRQLGFWYYTRFVKDREYPLYLRRRDAPNAHEEVLLDCNTLATGHRYFSIANFAVSENNCLLAYAEDTVGRRQYVIRIKNLLSNELLPDAIENAEPDMVWSNDGSSIFYLEKDPVTLLATRVRCHVLGNAQEDAIVYEEPDDQFALALEKSKSRRYILLGSESTVSSEWRYLDADNPRECHVLIPRERDHEYQVEHVGDHWIMRSNWLAPNFRIIAASLKSPAFRDNWRDIVPHDPNTFVHDFAAFSRHVAIGIRSEALRKLRIYKVDGSGHLEIDFQETAFCARLGQNPELDSKRLRFTYTSLATPAETYDYDLDSGERILLKQEPVLGNFDAAKYKTEMRWATAPDGEKIPVSLLYRHDLQLDGTASLYLYAYGAYGHSIDPVFGASRLSLVDRGFVYAIAHVRGGQELGRRWYDAGRMRNKMHTFTDFIAVTDFLVQERYAARDKVFAAGGSAGGLLMGVIANLAPERYRGIVAQVPFVDIVTTMLDESIPLTTLEYDEWGNPNNALDYAYLVNYSPYDNVRGQPYPAMLVTTGFWDSQVQYFEPAKWVAKLRAVNSSDNPLYLYVDMEAGHGGKSGRFQRYREIALEYTFVLSVLARHSR